MRLWLADIKGESEEAMLALLAVLMWLQLNGELTRAKLPLHSAYSYRHCVHTERLLP